MTQIILVGIGLEFAATLLGTLSKQSLRFSKLLEVRGRSVCGRLVLSVGLITNLFLGPAIDGLAYSFAPQSILAPLLGLDIIWNCVLAPFTLKETLTRGRLIGCLILTGGMVGTALTGPQTNSDHSLEALEHLLFQPRAYAYYALETALIFAGAVCIRLRPAGNHLRGFALGILGGVIGGNLFFLKATSELVTGSISDASYEVWLHPLPVALAIGAAACAAISAVLLTNGLREYEALSMVATYEGSMALSGCASGCAVMNEMDGQAPERILGYVVSLGLILFGLCVSQWGGSLQGITSGSCEKAAPLLEDEYVRV